MTAIAAKPWRIQDELIEQPSWGGRYIIDLKGLSDDVHWLGKKVGQSYELARSSMLIDPVTGEIRSLTELLTAAPRDFLGPTVVEQFGADISLLIKLTQAKGNSFQVHLPEGKERGHWLPKPEAWFYLAPGLFTFGLKPGADYSAYSACLREIDHLMNSLSTDVTRGAMNIRAAREQAAKRIAELNPYAFVNIVDAHTDDIVDLTAGGIHHSWEEDDRRYPQGNLVYEVQVDVPDWECSMRGFDKGKILDDGSIRSTHVDDYLATVEQDAFHNDLANHIRKPQVISDQHGIKLEALFRTPYFNLDRTTLAPGSAHSVSLVNGFDHLFVYDGAASIGQTRLEQGQSVFIPAIMGDYELRADTEGVVLLKTYLPAA